MAVLVSDTATRVLSVAVGSDGITVASAAVDVPRGHSKLLQPTMQSVLAAAGVTPRDLTAIGVGVGPGSYTGVRLGVSNAKAMAFALSLPLYRVSTLLALAEAAVPFNCFQPILVMPLLFARRGRAFGALYQKQNEAWQTVKPVDVLPVVDWVEHLKEYQVGRAQSSVASIVHDFPETDHAALIDMVESRGEAAHGGTSGLAVAHLQDVAGGIGRALVRLVAAGYAKEAAPGSVHLVVPEYGLQVEAEVKLGYRGDISDGRS